MIGMIYYKTKSLREKRRIYEELREMGVPLEEEDNFFQAGNYYNYVAYPQFSYRGAVVGSRSITVTKQTDAESVTLSDFFTLMKLMTT